MNILVDLINTQGSFFGSGVYIRKVFKALLEYVESNNMSDVRFVCTYDSKKEILYPDFNVTRLCENPIITVVDINTTSFSSICRTYNIDVVFLGFGQVLYDYDFTGVEARIVCVLHDVFNLEYENTKLDKYVVLDSYRDPVRITIKKWLYDKLGLKYVEPKKNNNYDRMIRFLDENNKYTIITVSQFSYYSLLNQLPIPKNRIEVLWSPEKDMPVMMNIENKRLKDVVDKGKRYFLVVSADRKLKNADRAVEAFVRYRKNNSDAADLYMLTVGCEEVKDDHHLAVPFLSDSDIEHAYRNCHALFYPSYFEGFGYPPLEAMKYGKPVLASNVCSMPEILEDSAIWFSPFYTTDLYRAIDTFVHSDYNDLCEKAYQQYNKVNDRQTKDLARLIDIIFDN